MVNLLPHILVVATLTVTCNCFSQLPMTIPIQTFSSSIGDCHRSSRNSNRRYLSDISTVIDEDASTPSQERKVDEYKGISKSTDPDYPYLFTGRLWFSPSIVKVPNEEMKSSLSSKAVNVVSLFGYTLGGTVTLEYDTSPVGPYKEYVSMSSLVTKRAALGQWGSRLYVSTQEAEDVCKEVWGVPAEVADIKFSEGVSDGGTDNGQLMVTKPPCPNSPTDEIQKIVVEGWKNTRVLKPDEYKNGEAQRIGNIPVLWTPTIKALYSPWVAGGVSFQTSNSDNDSTDELPLHKLRLSASAIRLSWSGFKRRLDNEAKVTEEEMGIPLGLGLVVDNVLIEIGSRYGNL